jgi:hypothetical protein
MPCWADVSLYEEPPGEASNVDPLEEFTVLRYTWYPAAPLTGFQETET